MGSYLETYTKITKFMDEIPTPTPIVVPPVTITTPPVIMPPTGETVTQFIEIRYNWIAPFMPVIKKMAVELKIFIASILILVVQHFVGNYEMWKEVGPHLHDNLVQIQDLQVESDGFTHTNPLYNVPPKPTYTISLVTNTVVQIVTVTNITK
jgi:hypothetical protein